MCVPDRYRVSVAVPPTPGPKKGTIEKGREKRRDRVKGKNSKGRTNPGFTWRDEKVRGSASEETYLE